MKIVGFGQLRNELSKGNLENWFKSMEFCDEIYIYDQDSDDGSKEHYKRQNNVYVIESPVNDFIKEMKCKAVLLKKLLKEQSDVDWIFWMDGDTILDGRLTREKIIKIMKEYGEYDGLILGHLNLWRSDTFYRVDNLFHWLHNKGVCAFWRNNGKLVFDASEGLHRYQFPDGIDQGYRIPYHLIHRGFATDDQILNRIDSYFEMPLDAWLQDGEDVLTPEQYRTETVERFLNEEELNVKHLPRQLLPSWFETKDEIDPKTKKRLRKIYEERS